MADVSWADGLSAISAFAGLGTAVIALRIGRTASKAAQQSSRAADQANATADAVASIERDRWHHEMTPRFDVTITGLGPGTDQARLILTFEGPPALERLDAVEIEIRNDGYPHRILPRGSSREEIRNTIWGPYRFKPHRNGSPAHGRMVQADHMKLGEWLHFTMEKSVAPSWTNATDWRDWHADAPVRLWVRCRREGHQPWTLTYNVAGADPQ
ncbi:hypothetical protein ABZS86_34095 [Streptomyces sp. NPDC005355]|uniref:hypothetical protein n=1 Tax=Streptomyces sp. NPDC005355 TaxID=3157038 RepID=UPI00339F05B9